MEPTGRREAPPDDRLRAIREQHDRSPGFRCAPSGLHAAGPGPSNCAKQAWAGTAINEGGRGGLRPRVWMIAVTDKIGSLRQGLFAKYVFALVGLVIFVLAVNGAMETWISYRATKATLTDAMGEKAEAAARRIEQSIAELERQISWVTRASADTLAKHNADYAQLLNQVAPVIQLALLDGAGREQLKMSRGAAAVVDSKA